MELEDMNTTFDFIFCICYGKYLLNEKDKKEICTLSISTVKTDPVSHLISTSSNPFLFNYSTYETFISELKKSPDMYFNKELDSKEINAWRMKLSIGSKVILCSSYFIENGDDCYGVVTSLHCKNGKLDSVELNIDHFIGTHSVPVYDVRLKQYFDEEKSINM